MSEETEKKGSILGSIVKILVGLGVIAALVFIFVIRPSMIEMQLKAKRAELPINLKGIQTSMQMYQEMEGKYIAIQPYPKETAIEPRSWVEAESGNFQKIGYTSDMGVYGSYWVEVTETDFTAYGISDIDGDGVFATYMATSKEYPKALNDAF